MIDFENRPPSFDRVAVDVVVVGVADIEVSAVVVIAVVSKLRYVVKKTHDVYLWKFLYFVIF